MEQVEKKTEAEWQKTIDDFWLGFTPLWFDFLQWLLVIGAIGFASSITSNIYLRSINIFSYFALFSYLQSTFFTKIKISKIIALKNKDRLRDLSLLISALITYFFWRFVVISINAIINYMKL